MHDRVTLAVLNSRAYDVPTGTQRLTVTVAGQNSNNSVRVTDALFASRYRMMQTGNYFEEQMAKFPKLVKGTRIMGPDVGHAAWACADPGSSVS